MLNVIGLSCDAPTGVVPSELPLRRTVRSLPTAVALLFALLLCPPARPGGSGPPLGR